MVGVTAGHGAGAAFGSGAGAEEHAQRAPSDATNTSGFIEWAPLYNDAPPNVRRFPRSSFSVSGANDCRRATAKRGKPGSYQLSVRRPLTARRVADSTY